MIRKRRQIKHLNVFICLRLSVNGEKIGLSIARANAKSMFCSKVGKGIEVKEFDTYAF